MGIEHTICDRCQRQFADLEERVYPEKCPMCGATQGTHSLGWSGWLLLLAVVGIGVIGKHCNEASASGLW